MYQPFLTALEAGHANEQTIAEEFAYHGIPVIRTEGKNDYDLYLPDGRSIEIKLDLFSQRTGNGIIEFPSLQRGADIYLHTFTYCRAYTHQEYEWLYRHGKVAAVGEQQYEARIIPKVEMKAQGVFLDTFIKSLKQIDVPR